MRERKEVSVIAISEIKFKITADLSGFKESVNEASQTMKNVSETTKKASKETGGLLKNVGKMIGTIGGIKLVSASFDMIKSSIGDAVKRIDVLNNSNRVFENMGFTVKETEDTMKALNKSITGLPTPLDSAIKGVQLVASSVGNLSKSEKIFSALNNGILGFGGNTGQVENAVVQLSQAFSNGKIDAQTWNSMINSGLGPALNAMGKQMGITTGDLKKGLSEGSISVSKFQDALINLNTNGGGGLRSLQKIAQDSTAGISTGVSNMKTAVVRGTAAVITAFDNVLKGLNLGGISTVIAQIGTLFETSLKGFSVLVEKYLPVLVATFRTFFSTLSGEVDLTPVAWMINVVKVSLASIGDIVKSVIPAMLSDFKQLQTVMIPIINNVVDVISVLTVGIVKAFQHVLPTAITIAKASISVLTEVFAPLILKISVLASVISEFVTEILLGKLRDAFNVINTTLKENESLFKALVIGVTAAVIAFKTITTLVTIFKTIKTAIVGAQAAFAAFNAVLLANPIALVIAAVVGLVAGIAYLWKTNEEFKTKITAIWESIVKVFSSAKDAVIIAWETVIEFFSSVWDSLKLSAQAVLLWLNNVWTVFSIWMASLWGEIKDAASLAWSAFVMTIQSIIDPFTVLFISLWENVKQGLASIWDGISQIAAGSWKLIKNIILAPVLLVVDLITGDFSSMGSHLVQIWGNIKEAAKTIWNGIKDYLTGVVSSIVGVVTTYFQTLKAVISFILESIKMIAVSVWNNIKNALFSIINSLVKGAISTWNSFRSFMNGLWRGVKVTTINAWNGIRSGTLACINGLVSGARNAWNTLKVNVSTTINTVKRLFTSLREINLFQIGKNIIQGLVNGIYNMVGSVGRAISDVAGNIKDKITSALGIHSPSRWMRDMVGVNLMKGLTIGIDLGEDGPLKAIKSFTDNLQDAATVEGSFSSVGIGEATNSQYTGIGNLDKMSRIFIERSTEVPNSSFSKGVVINVDSMIVRNADDARKIGKYIVEEADRRDRFKGKRGY